METHGVDLKEALTELFGILWLQKVLIIHFLVNKDINDFARSGYGDIAEIGIYNTALNDTEILNLSTNLSQKFGITLDTII